MGDFDFLDAGPNGSHPYHNENPDGLFFSIIRPQGTPTDSIGIWSTLDYSKWTTPTQSFLVTASFRDPDRQPLNVKDPFGTFAASILINLDNPAFKYCGVTAQIRLVAETSFMFGNGHNKSNPIKFIMAGLGTASGYYKCSLKMTEFEIFMPISA